MPKFDKKRFQKAEAAQRTAFGPEALAAQAPELFNLLLSSPMFADALRLNAVGANQLQSSLAANLGASGGSTTGIGKVAQAAGRGAGAFGASNLMAGLGQTSLGLTQENLMNRMASLAGIEQAFQKRTFGEKLMGAVGGVVGGLMPGINNFLFGGGGGGGGQQ